MRIKLMLAPLLFLLSFTISGTKEEKVSKIETDNLPNIDVSDGLDDEHDDKTNGPAVRTVKRSSPTEETTELIDDYYWDPWCGDKPMRWDNTCFCGNRSLSGDADLRDGDFYCCVHPFGQNQCTGDRFSDVRCDNGEVRHKTEPCHQNCWNNRQPEMHWTWI